MFKALLIVLGLSIHASAATLTLDYSGGAATMSGGGALGFAIGEKDELNVGLDFTRNRSMADPDDEYSNTLGASLKGRFDSAWSWGLGFDFTRDFANEIDEASPQANLHWRWLGEAGEAESGAGLFIVDLKLGSGFYSLPLKTTTRRPGPLARPIITTTTLTLKRLSPRVMLSLPLFQGDVTPWISATQVMYDSNPADFESKLLAQRAFIGPQLSRVDALTKQLIQRYWAAGLDLDLPWDSTLNASWARTESLSNPVMSTAWSAGAGISFGPAEFSSTWTRSVYDDASTYDSFNGSVAYSF